MNEIVHNQIALYGIPVLNGVLMYLYEIVSIFTSRESEICSCKGVKLRANSIHWLLFFFQ